MSDAGARKPEGYADLGDLSEDERITIIGRTVVERGMTVAVCVDDQPANVARYIRKIRDRFPTVVVIEQFKGPAKGIVTIKLGPQ